MAQSGKALFLGLTVHLFLATILHQGVADFVTTPTPQQITPSPHKGTDIPAQGDYKVRTGNGTVCLKAMMGLQLNISFLSASLKTTVQTVVNINPNETQSSGSCKKESATLKLNSGEGKTELAFGFVLNTTTNKYHLNKVSLLAIWPDMKEAFSAHNDSLDYLRGISGFSYMCRSTQTLEVSQDFSLNTYLLHVQPFGLTEDQFGPALECYLDEDDMIIPIVVGASLAGLVLIVLLAYLIGRKRSHAGYQTIWVSVPFSSSTKASVHYPTLKNHCLTRLNPVSLSPSYHHVTPTLSKPPNPYFNQSLLLGFSWKKSAPELTPAPELTTFL